MQIFKPVAFFQNIFCWSLICGFFALGLAETCIHLSHTGLSQSGRHSRLLLVPLAKGVYTGSCSIQLIKRQLMHLFEVFWPPSSAFVLSLQQLNSVPIFYPELRKCLCSFPSSMIGIFWSVAHTHSRTHVHTCKINIICKVNINLTRIFLVSDIYRINFCCWRAWILKV